MGLVKFNVSFLPKDTAGAIVSFITRAADAATELEQEARCRTGVCDSSWLFVFAHVGRRMARAVTPWAQWTSRACRLRMSMRLGGMAISKKLKRIDVRAKLADIDFTRLEHRLMPPSGPP